MEIFSIAYSLLVAQGALLDAVTPELRAVVVDFDTPELYIRFYYDGKVDEDIIELWGCAITEASAGLGPDCLLDAEVKRLDYPKEIPFRGRYAYLRKENNITKNNPRLNKAILEHPDLLKIIHKYCGKGKKINDVFPGQPGYREMVNFEEFIGYSINRITNEKMKTNSGVIHYSKGGVNIIPAYQGNIKDLKKTYPISYAMLAMQTALLGAVTPELRSVVVDFSEENQLLYIRMYYDGKVSEDLLDLWECAISEACADLGSECLFDTKVERIDFPNEVPFRGRYAYIRKE